MTLRKSWCAALALLLSVTGVPRPAGAQSPSDPPPAAEVTPDPWPKSVDLNGATYTIYQPQLESWDGYRIEAHAAVSVKAAGATDAVFGAIDITAFTSVDKLARVVTFQLIKVATASFPSAPAKATGYQAELQSILTQGPGTMSLDRLQAALNVVSARKTGQAVPVQNKPPSFIFSQGPAVLVSIYGAPAWTAAGPDFERVINSRALLLRDKKGGMHLHLYDGFVAAETLAGPWKVEKKPPQGAAEEAQALASKDLVDLMEGPPDREQGGKKPSLEKGAPDVYVATVPTELIVIDGLPSWVPLEGTNLLYVENTTANLFKDTYDQQTYILVTGRWFRGPGFSGPWEYVPGRDLPVDFAQIPNDSPKENVKASVPGTPQAEDAKIAVEIPQTATIDRTKAKFTPEIDGAPQMKPIPDTALQYVYNSPSPIIEVSPAQWYAVDHAVWFTATSVKGPWAIATSVPPAIYSIPASSPVHYVTYVQVYASTPQVVVVGYTPGYSGAIIATDGVVVYGTGYTYVPYIAPTIWYPPPTTYGYAVNMAYTPWTGWAFGFGFGWGCGAAYSSAWGWGAVPYYGAAGYAYGTAGYVHGAYGGAAAWGPGGWAATTGNMYSHYGATSAVTRSSAGYNAWTGNAWSSQVGHSYNSATGRVSAGQTASVANAYTGGYAYGNRGATYNPTTGVAAAGGRATVGNAYTGQQATVGHATVAGPGGETTHVAQVNNNYYADHDGNVYKSQGDGSFQKYNSDGGWTNESRSATQSSLQSQESARASGESRSASSGWGGGSGWDHSGDSGGSRWGGGGDSGGRSWGGGNFGGRSGGGGGGFGGFRGRR
jgi:hypothetical protein